jgi:ABC-2 type transport system ATP-binding protein
VDALLEVRGIEKRFGGRAALRGVSLAAARGEVVAVIGPNGAGKTTLLSIIAGIQKPDAGEVSLQDGEIGWVPQQTALYLKLTVAENLRLFARLERVSDVEAVVDRMLRETGLEERAGDQVATLSGGNRQRVNVAIGLLSAPAALLLDEPTTALDPRHRERLWEFIGGLARGGTTVLFTTHNVAEAERHADRVAILADGELLFSGATSELDRLVGRDVHSFEEAFVAFLQERGH